MCDKVVCIKSNRLLFVPKCRRDGYYSNLVKHMGDGQSHWLPQDPRGIIVDMIKMMKLTTKNGARSRKYR